MIFPQMHLIQHKLAEGSNLEMKFQITIAAERRLFLKRRWRATADDGTEFGFDLDSRLNDQCVIYHQNGYDYIVRQLPETVYEVQFNSSDHAAMVAWKVGNLHLPVEVLPDRLRVLRDEAMAQLLARELWEFSEPTVIFTPLKSMAHA